MECIACNKKACVTREVRLIGEGVYYHYCKGCNERIYPNK